MEKYYIVPKNHVIAVVEKENKDDVLPDFAAEMDSDLNTYFKTAPSIIEPSEVASNGVIYYPVSIPSELFQFYILSGKEYKDGTHQWKIGVDVRNGVCYKFGLSSRPEGYIILDSIRGTKEDAENRLKEILEMSLC